MSKEAIKNLLIDFMADYDPNKWSNDDVYEKYAEKIDNVRSMGEIIAFTELTKKVKDLEAKLAESEKLLEKHCYANIQQLEDVFNYNLNQVAHLSQENVCLKNDVAKRNGEIAHLKQQLAEKELKIIELETKLNLKDKATNV